MARKTRARLHAGIPSLDAMIARHLEHLRLRGLASSSVYQRRRGLIRLAAALPVSLLDADAAMLAAWRAGLTVGERAVGTYISDVRQFYGWALAEGLIEDDPAVKLVVPRRGRSLPRPIGEDELFDALAEAPRRVRPWLVLAAWAGLRAKEIAFLRRDRVLDTATVPSLLIAGDATKGRDERIVPLSEFALHELRWYGLPASGWVFRRHDGQAGPNHPHQVSHLANAFLHSMGIAETLHQLRHRFGTETYRASRDLRAVQEMMGHRLPETTAGYAAYANASAIAAVNSLPVPARMRRVAAGEQG